MMCCIFGCAVVVFTNAAQSTMADVETEAEESVCNIEEVMYGVDKEANNNNSNTSTPSVQKKRRKQKMV